RDPARRDLRRVVQSLQDGSGPAQPGGAAVRRGAASRAREHRGRARRRGGRGRRGALEPAAAAEGTPVDRRGNRTHGSGAGDAARQLTRLPTANRRQPESCRGAESVRTQGYEERPAGHRRHRHGYLHDARHGDAIADLQALRKLAGPVRALRSRTRHGGTLGYLIRNRAARRDAFQRPDRGSSERMKRLLLVAIALFCVLGGTARADGDPASDYLLGTQVFIPFDLKLPKASQQELTSLVHDANTSGYTIRVALVGSAYDMGSVTSLWRKPKPYAKFLGTELAFVYKNRLLVVM